MMVNNHVINGHLTANHDRHHKNTLHDYLTMNLENMRIHFYKYYLKIISNFNNHSNIQNIMYAL